MAPKRTPIGQRAAPAPAEPRTSPALEALLGRAAERHAIIAIPLRSIMPNRWQPRTNPSPEGLQELAQSIQQYGVLEPVILRPIPLTLYEGSGRQYELIAGERRWRACALAGLPTVPARVLDEPISEQLMLELAITENLQREDLHPLDEARSFGRMHDELGYSYAQIAERLGKSKGYVQNRLRLLHLDDDLHQLILTRPDTLGHVYELARIGASPERAALVAAVRDDALSRAETRQRVQQILAAQAAGDAGDGGGSYFQKYDSAGSAGVGDAGDVGSAYFQKYDPDLATGSWIKPLLAAMQRTQHQLQQTHHRFEELEPAHMQQVQAALDALAHVLELARAHLPPADSPPE